ncbi:MAG: PVC-type heme-binding CxxCH protein [Opitutaceae bacterium]
MNRFFALLAALLTTVPLYAADTPLFDGKTFTGWEGDTMSTWRIEKGAFVAGSLVKPQAENDFLATTRQFANFELNLKWKLEGTKGFVNGGVQFRTKRIPNSHEVSGYQADLGAGYDGALYDESRRNRVLARPSPDALAKASKPLGEWNNYRIRAEGARIRIWLNGVQTVDFTETDPSIATSGIIAVQIHGGATSVVGYRDLRIEELPVSEKAAPKGAFNVQSRDVVALTGGSNMERMRFHGWLQTHLIAARPDGKIKVRNFGWEGDTVFEQWRDAGAANSANSWRQQREWRQQLRDAGATVVLAQFGQMESLAGAAKVPQFIAAFEKLIAEFAEEGRRVALVAPVTFEGKLAAQNESLAAYTRAIRELAAKLKLNFIEIEKNGENRGARTDNGYQLNDAGHRFVARRIAEGLGIAPVENEAVRREVLEMERLWFDYWRPMNWAFLSGDRTTQAYAKDWRDRDKRIFPQEMEDFLPLLEQADQNIWAALVHKPVSPIGVRSSIPVEAPSAKPLSPDEEKAQFQILDGFEVNLFASEADGMVKPIQMRWDERGRLWVACAASYPQIKPGEKANDYVLVCEDTDGDGRADTFTKFAEGLFMPTGIELGNGGLYVAQGSELLHLRDTDGDGKADTRRIVLGGFGTGDSHQNLNGLNWGFGGELWFTQGHHIYSRVETPSGVETLNRSGVWRWRPRTGHLDPFFQFSSAGANCWGVVTSEFGQPFHKSGANSGSWFSTPGLVRSSLAVNAQAMNLFQAPIKQVGQEFLHSSHFPAEMQGRMIIGGYYANVLEQHELKLENGVFKSTQLPSIIKSRSTVFRPIEVRMGPDGAIYVTDWYNPIIGHYQASYRHPDRDKEHGRIWRVTWKGGKKVTPAKLAGTSVPELLEQLDSKERWAWYQSKRLLIERDTKEVIAALDEWLPKQQGNEYRRLLALSLYEAHETPRPALLAELLRSADVRIRAYATRVIGTWARDGHLPEVLKLLEAQIADDDALVRLEAIVAASYVNDPRAATIAARALDKDFNGYHRHALTKTLHATNPLWSAPLVAGKLGFDQDEHLIFALQNGWVENNVNDLVAREFADDKRPHASAKSAEIMRGQIAKHATDPTRQRRWLSAFAAIAAASDVSFIFNLAGRDSGVLGALRSSRPAGAEQLLTPLFDSTRADLRAQGVRLAGLWKIAAFADRIRPLAFEKNMPDALDALISISPNEATRNILARVASLKTPQEAAPLLGQLLNRTEGRNALERALQEPEALSVAGAKRALQALNLLGRSDRTISPQLMKLAGISTALPVYRKETIAKIVSDAATLGDAAEGKKVYEQAGCIACHTPGPTQSKIGPDLSSISRGLPVDMIVTEVIWPALNVKEGYEAATITMKDGTVVTGFKQTETAEAIAIRDMTTGTVKSIPRNETQSIKTGGTVMPDGLTAPLNAKQLADLIRYLSELGRESQLL